MKIDLSKSVSSLKLYYSEKENVIYQPVFTTNNDSVKCYKYCLNPEFKGYSPDVVTYNETRYYLDRTSESDKQFKVNKEVLSTPIPLTRYHLIKQVHQQSDSYFLGECGFWVFGGNNDLSKNTKYLEGLKKLGLTYEQSSTHITPMFGCNMLSSVVPDFTKLMDEQYNQIKEYLSTSEGFFDASLYELQNHEYCYSMDLEPALNALGYMITDTLTEVQADALRRAINIAKKES